MTNEDDLPYYETNEIALFKERCEGVKELYETAQNLFFPLGHAQMSLIAGLFDYLGLNVGVVGVLLKYCAENGRLNRVNIVKLAKEWAQDGVNTVDEAKERVEMVSKTYRDIMRAFGIVGRYPTKKQCETFKKWLKEWSLPQEVVVAACEKAFEATGKTSLAYADKILSNSKEDKPPEPQKNDLRKGRNRFANFDERGDINFSELERKERELLMKRFGDK